MPSFTTAPAAAALLLASVFYASRVKMTEDMDLGADDAAEDVGESALPGSAAAAAVGARRARQARGGGSVYTSSLPKTKSWGNPWVCSEDVCNAVLECFKNSNGRDPKFGGKSSLGSCYHLTHGTHTCMWSWSLKVPKVTQRKCDCYKVQMYNSDEDGFHYLKGSQYTACPSDCGGLNKTACAEKLQLEKWDEKCMKSSSGNRVACG
eukprot:TRINITY_DN8005_c0_g2_i1.p1 TRINITY_DN8005_c0_g2~~TRINITY_DN8005_c0_g2_i1.p1  ORF type:complete len:228 (-),score=45.67 TRINITY_DN8005_c0_g2_i1:153-773(-)